MSAFSLQNFAVGGGGGGGGGGGSPPPIALYAMVCSPLSVFVTYWVYSCLHVEGPSTITGLD